MDRVSFDTSLLGGLSTVPARSHHEGVATSVLASAWRRRLLVLVVTGAALALSAGALTLLEKSYVGEAIIQLDVQKRDGGAAAEQPSLVALEAGAVVQSEARIVKSRAIAKRVVDRLGLADAAEPGWHLRSLLPPWLQDALPAARAPGDAADRTEAAVSSLMAKLSVESDIRSYLITIRATADRPEQAARIANAVAEEYIRRRLEASAAAADRQVAWLGQQIAAGIAQLRDADAAVAEQRERTGLVEPGGEANRLDQQQAREIAAQLSAATLARISEEGRLTRVRELQRSGTALSSADLQGSPVMQQLVQRESMARKDLGEMRARFGLLHPSVVRAQANVAELSQALSVEAGRAVAVLEAGTETARRTEQALKNRLDALRQAMLLARGGEIEFHDRVTAAQMIRDRLALLARSHDQALAQRDLRTVPAFIAVQAEPVRTAVFPKPLIILALGLAGGLGAGVAAAVLWDRQDHGLRTATDVADRLQRRCLGVLPELRSGRSQALFDEAIRSVGAGVGLFGAARECLVVMVTSSVPDEGASMLSQALSRSLVSAGQRVLLIDGSPSRPGQHAPAEGGGVADEAGKVPAVLSGEMLTVVQRSTAVMLKADVFGSGKFARLLDQARKHFDLIIIEAPPVLLVPDALVLGRMADRVVLAARWSRTRRAVVEAAIARLEENSVVVDGVALTRVNLRRQKRAGVADQCAYYVRERRYYERLATPDTPAAAPAAASVSHTA